MPFIPRNESNLGVDVVEEILWDNVSTGVDGASKILDLKHCSNLSVFGVVQSGSTVTFEVSRDGVEFFLCGRISSNLPQSGDSFPKDFHLYPTIGARYIRLKSTNDVIITAYAQARP